MPLRLTLVALLLAGCLRRAPRSTQAAPNVLFIAVDDLRPLIGAYGSRMAKTPNLDALVARGALFEHAYCQQALCNPSRSSLMTGRRPDSLHVYNLETHFRKLQPQLITMPQYFKQHGYDVEALGKIFHNGMDDPQSWSVSTWWPDAPRYDARVGNVQLGPSWQAAQLPDDGLADGKTAEEAVARLHRLRGQRFFLAVGFSKPHLPFVAPSRYYDLYPPQSIELADNPFPPSGVSTLPLGASYELRAYQDIPKEGAIPDDKARELVRGYYASVSYLDAQIGRVLTALDREGLRERTIVVVWGDHGFHLGEHGIWCKSTNFEVAARAPLIVAAPQIRSGGEHVDAIVELVDIYPTLAELVGLPKPFGLDGTSFAPLLGNPLRSWKRAAFAQTMHGDWMGRSVRTVRYRYTEWTGPGDGHSEQELYNHDVESAENVNLAARPESANTVAELRQVLHDGWRAALPPPSK